MKVGSLVECIYQFDQITACRLGASLPIKGNLYVVREIDRQPEFGTNKIVDGVLLEEIINCRASNGIEYGFVARGFREVQPPMEISIESLISESLTV